MNIDKPYIKPVTTGTMFDWRWERKTLKDMREDFAKELVDTERIVKAFDRTTDIIKTKFEESKEAKIN